MSTPDTYTERRRHDHERARALNLTLLWILEATDIAPFHERCVVRSQSHPESAHEVALTWDTSGPLVVCGCIGFQRRGTCVHAATVEVTLIDTGEMRDPFDHVAGDAMPELAAIGAA